MTETVTTTSSDKSEKKNYLFYTSPNHRPPTVVRAEGVYLYLEDGTRIMDATGGAAVACLGHGNKEVIDAMHKQSEKVCYIHSMGFSNEPADKLANLLVSEHPDVFARAYFANSGSEAVETCLKLILQYWQLVGEKQRCHIIARKQGYHGNTLFALSVGGMKPRKQPYEGVFSHTTSHVSPCFEYRYKENGETTEEYVARLAKELEDEILRVGPEKVAAFVAETVSGACTGCATPVPGYFKAMRKVCDKYGVIFYLDEVMSGIGRTGTMHAWEQEGVTPDIQSIAKCLGGGYQPISGALVGHRIMNVFEQKDAAMAGFFTYQAHPIACSAALAVQTILRRDHLVERAAEMGKYLSEKLHETFDSHPNVGNIRGRGLFWGLEIVKDKATKECFPPEYKVGSLANKIGCEHGVFVYPGMGTIDGTRGDHVLLAPPYIITREQIDELVEALSKTITSTVAALP
ncbi:Aspartate aminotransferase family protein [Schizosaccharomyces pombe]|uniref:Uncharacterized aminotransferase C1771.03c n=1 Tax=Schizosaccharomyces pombe (strain 972 / ATCC 24843) TaxID=284812 RepID=YGD3_SCHPO|nr:aminotransferase [Schizosaccharomyces pombe]O94562.1 RecName: Full=Uncharacterized aminotransferase C1771.03c [Schizosaccharomyces pombe 972h-]CAA21908.1 aminotransferase class-III, unknown specificty [Schizosaccharomyces pombe]|eukprot:NP_595118.1 aminotransferase [Schizosaccharomyces pombe]